MRVGLWLTALLRVVIDGGNVDAAALEAAVAGCDEVLASSRCEPAQEAAPDADFYACFSADALISTVQLQVHRARPDGPLSLSRELHLDASASSLERARAVGLVVAAHVLASEPKQEAPPPVRVPAAARRVFRLDGAVGVGSALDAGPVRAGLLVRGSMLARRLPLGWSLAVHGAYRPGTPTLGWVGAGAGAVARWELGRFALEGRLEGVAQHTIASAGGERGSALRWGGRAGAELHTQIRRQFGLFLAGEGTLLGPRVELAVAGRERGAEPPASWNLLLGARRSW